MILAFALTKDFSVNLALQLHQLKRLQNHWILIHLPQIIFVVYPNQVEIVKVAVDQFCYPHFIHTHLSFMRCQSIFGDTNGLQASAKPVCPQNRRTTLARLESTSVLPSQSIHLLDGLSWLKTVVDHSPISYIQSLPGLGYCGPPVVDCRRTRGLATHPSATLATPRILVALRLRLRNPRSLRKLQPPM